MLAYSLSENINGEKLLKDIQSLVQKTVVPNKRYVLTIKVNEIDYENDSLIPKLTSQDLDHAQSPS